MLGTDAGQGEKPVSSRTAAREAFFLEFAKAIRQDFPQVPLLVTGGFRSRQAMESAVVDGGCDMIGLARPAVLNPTLPKSVIFNAKIQDEDAKVHADRIQPSWLIKMIGVKAIGAGTEGVSKSDHSHSMLGLMMPRTGIASRLQKWQQSRG